MAVTTRPDGAEPGRSARNPPSSSSRPSLSSGNAINSSDMIPSQPATTSAATPTPQPQGRARLAEPGGKLPVTGRRLTARLLRAAAGLWPEFEDDVDRGLG